QSLHDKTILLQEIHHRVKNNLAVIIGLLHLQSFNSKNDELGVFYDEMSNRIKSIADVHELLYSSETLSQINLKSYIGKLFNNVLSLSKSDVELNPLIFIDENFEMNINQAIPLGLLVNELLTNSVKHAFKGIDNPTISFTVIKEEESISISYKDNGVGFEIEGHSSPTSLGFTLINTLLGQLEANYSFTNSIGFGIEFSIPLVKQGSHSYLSN
ncbi:MAG: sensor histidine kinase, partial [Balneolaceae bacterium]